MILSFHPLFVGDKNILCAGRDPGPEELKSIREAFAVVLPQGCRKSLYDMARNHCSKVFPDYDTRFKYPGKIGQTRLFREINTPHPKTKIYDRKEEFLIEGQIPSVIPFEYPFVFKFDWGGEGETVFLIDSAKQLREAIEVAETFEQTGQKGFLLQEYIPSRGRSLRVVVIGNQYMAYWRKAGREDGFYSNLSKGANVDETEYPEKRESAISAAKDFCSKTKINLAGIDFLFSSKNQKFYFLEINYFFGRRGLGGSEKYYKILLHEINDWIRRLKS